jgi:hypothetical protein
MGEMNSVSCGGAAGVSDVYASALWIADVSMQLASAGVDGVNFHGGAPPGGVSYYAPFVLDAAGAPIVRPVYYGMRLVSLVTAAHGRLLPATVGTTAATVEAFATVGDDGAVRVLVLRLGEGGPDTVHLAVGAGAPSHATLVRLRAPSLTSSTGLSLGGQTWDGSTDGTPAGTLEEETLSGTSFTLAPFEAAVVTLAP